MPGLGFMRNYGSWQGVLDSGRVNFPGRATWGIPGYDTTRGMNGLGSDITLEPPPLTPGVDYNPYQTSPMANPDYALAIQNVLSATGPSGVPQTLSSVLTSVGSWISSNPMLALGGLVV